MSFDEEGSICVEATVSDEDTYPLGCSGGPYLAGWESVDAVGRQLLDEIPEEAGNKAST